MRSSASAADMDTRIAAIESSDETTVRVSVRYVGIIALVPSRQSGLVVEGRE